MSNLVKITFLVALSLLACLSNVTAVADVAADPNCPSRESIIQCASKHLDTNGNKMLEKKELEDAIDTLPWYMKGVLKIIGSTDMIMKVRETRGTNIS
mmetsp:Transcript_8337/g.18196  ORF Transcript_8337/g.18196 Transcript_8337/m.18196 type:complete len:98 (+) Transcript_8337:161-454(+)